MPLLCIGSITSTGQMESTNSGGCRSRGFTETAPRGTQIQTKSSITIGPALAIMSVIQAMRTQSNDICKRTYCRFTGRTELRESSWIQSREREALETRSTASTGFLPSVAERRSARRSLANTRSDCCDPTKSRPIVDLHLTQCSNFTTASIQSCSTIPNRYSCEETL